MLKMKKGIFRDSIINLGLRMQKFLIDDPENGDVNLINQLFPIYGYSYMLDQDPKYANKPIFNDASSLSLNNLLQEAWDNISCSNCAAIGFTSRQESSTVPRINAKFVTMQDIAGNGSTMCRDLISQTDALTKLGSVPPTPLVNSYYECRKTVLFSFLSVLGSSFSGTNFIMTMMWIVGGYSFLTFFERRRRERGLAPLLSKRSKLEMQEALEVTKNKMLLAVMADIVAVLEQESPPSPSSPSDRHGLQKRRQRLRRDFESFKALVQALSFDSSGEKEEQERDQKEQEEQEEESGDVHMPSEEDRLRGLRSQVLAALVKAENALELEQLPTADLKNPLGSNSSSSAVEMSPLSRRSVTDIIGATAAANSRLSAGSPRSSLSSGSRRDLESS
jgi:hypothetical protein